MIDDRTDITPDAALAALAAPLFVENDGEGALFLRGLGLQVEINLAEPGTRYNPDGPGILAQPDAMDGIVGYGATRDAAALACRDRMLELLRTPAEMFDALAEGAERAATIEWAEAERSDHKDTPLNNEAHWHVIQRGTMQTAAKLMRAAQALAEHDLAADSQAILDKTQGRVSVKPEALADAAEFMARWERVKPGG